MPGPTEDHVVFDSFSHGEYGLAPPWNVGWRLLRQRSYYAGAFTSRDVQRSLHGSLHPRSGLVDVSPTGVPNGKLKGFTWTGVPAKDLLFVVGNTVYDSDSTGGGAASAYTNTFAITPTVPVAFALAANGIAYATVYGDKTYKVDQNTRTVTALTNSPGGACIAIYGDKLVVGNISGNAHRVFFSGDTSALPGSLGDFTKWDVLNFFDVGDAWPVNALLPQRTALVIAKQQSWHLLTGTPGVNDVLRVLNQDGPWVQSMNQAALAGDNTIWFVDFNRDTLNAFTGAQMAEEEFLSFNGGTYAFTALPPTFGVVRGYRNHDVFFGAVTTPGGSMKAAIRQDGAWTYHTFSPPGGFDGAWVAGGDGHRGPVPALRFSNGGGTSAPAKFYAWVTNKDRPPLSGGTLESMGDASSTALNPTVTLPEYWVRAGEEVTVRSVVVDFVGWNHGFSDTLHFEPRIQALNTYGDANTPGLAGAVVTPTANFDEPASWAGSAGQSKSGRITFNFAGEMGNGWQLSFANLRGVELKKILVKIQLSPMRGT